MDPISIAMALGQFVPQITKWLTGSDKAEAVAKKAVDVAQQVTGTTSGDAAVKALQTDPALVLKFRETVLSQEVSFEQLAVQNAADVNKTMQTEAAADHWPTYTWRPTIGFAVAFNVFASSVLVLAVFVATIFGRKEAATAVAQLPTVLGALAGINATVLPILGIASWFRGKMQADPSLVTDNRG
jgi:hypothetical protein